MQNRRAQGKKFRFLLTIVWICLFFYRPQAKRKRDTMNTQDHPWWDVYIPDFPTDTSLLPPQHIYYSTNSVIVVGDPRLMWDTKSSSGYFTANLYKFPCLYRFTSISLNRFPQ